MPIDILEFFVLTPLPGSADHKAMVERGEWMEPDLNRYDVEHVTMRHPRMSRQEWSDIYDRAWRLYYSPQHVETLLRRAVPGAPERATLRRRSWSTTAPTGSNTFMHFRPACCEEGPRHTASRLAA